MPYKCRLCKQTGHNRRTCKERQPTIVTNPSNEGETCPVCYDIVRKGVKCKNGHECCEKHFIQRARAIYQEGRCAFRPASAHCQKCFLCRIPIPDRNFSPAYGPLLHTMIVVEMGKQRGATKDHIREMIYQTRPKYDYLFGSKDGKTTWVNKGRVWPRNDLSNSS